MAMGMSRVAGPNPEKFFGETKKSPFASGRLRERVKLAGKKSYMSVRKAGPKGKRLKKHESGGGVTGG